MQPNLFYSYFFMLFSLSRNEAFMHLLLSLVVMYYTPGHLCPGCVVYHYFPFGTNLMETILWIKLMETILCKIRMDNLMERGARLGKFVVLKNVWRTARYVWNNYLCERESYCEAKRSKYDSQLAMQTYGTTLWCDRRELLLQVRTNERSE